jgi:hypothetical protein
MKTAELLSPDAVIQFAREPNGNRLAVMHCPGCGERHFVRVDGPHKWGFNEDVARPTFSPSVLVRARASDPTDPDAVAIESVCHFHVREGNIDYLGDCTHKLAGTSQRMVPVVAWPSLG